MVIVVTPPGRDGNGDPLPGSGAEEVVCGANVQQRTTSETVNGRQTVTTGLVAFLPAGVRIGPECLVRHRGVEYRVDGAPHLADDLNGSPHHIEVPLKAVTG